MIQAMFNENYNILLPKGQAVNLFFEFIAKEFNGKMTGITVIDYPNDLEDCFEIILSNKFKKIDKIRIVDYINANLPEMEIER